MATQAVVCDEGSCPVSRGSTSSRARGPRVIVRDLGRRLFGGCRPMTGRTLEPLFPVLFGRALSMRQNRGAECVRASRRGVAA